MSEISGARLDAPGLRGWAHDAVGHLITHTDEINRLNVFPVADSDTGTNMLFTMRSAVVWADDRAGDDAAAGVAGVAAALAEGALHGARGNSGVILSQILRALAEVTAARGVTEVDGPVLAEALRRAEGLVVASMGEAVPGTIVSVLQAAAGAAEQQAGAGADVVTVVGAGAEAAAAALARTTDQLDVLAEAGVVDAGGRGLLVLLDAMTVTLTGAAPRRPSYQPAVAQAETVTTAAAPQFEVMYLLSDCRQDGAARLRGLLDGLGDSVAIGDAGAGRFSVHVHTDDAGGAVEAGLSVGSLSRIQITALSGAHPNTHRTRDRAVLAVVDGDGAAELFAGEGARVLRAGATPITAQQLLRALVEADAAQVMLLPNGYIAAEELVAGCTAATGWGIDVVPVPAASMVQGLAALAMHDPGRQTVDDGYTMARAAAATRHGSVRVAAESALTWAGACKAGDGLGITGDEVLIVAHDIATAASGLVDLLLASGGELVTVLMAAGVDDTVGDQLRKHVHQQHLGIEVTCYRTGHDGDALLIGVE